MKRTIKRMLFLTMTLTALMLCCLFSFTASAEAGGDFSSARSIKVNTKYTDNIERYNDTDYFKFNINSDGYIYLNFTRENIYDAEEYWVANLYNEQTEFITNFSFSGNEVETDTYKVGLAVGTYYLKVTGGDIHSGDCSWRFSKTNYCVSIKNVKSSYWEKENNATYHTATDISINKKYQGTICESSDIDIYKFTLSSAGYIYMKFTRENLFEPNERWTATLYNEKAEHITDYSFSGSEISTNTYRVGLGAGTYFVKIKGGSWHSSGYSRCYSTENYSFNVNFKNNKYWEKEKNETYETATKISLNQKYSGSICQNRDWDFYKFTVQKKTDINFNFYENITNSTNEYYRIIVLDSNSKELEVINIYGNSSVVANKLTFNTGTYYLKIIGGAWSYNLNESRSYSTDTYTFSVSIGATSKITSTKTASSVALKWNKVSGATGYRVFQKVNGKWKNLGDTSKTAYTIKNLKAGTKYSFAVRAYILDGKTKVMAPKYKTISVTTADALGVTSKLTATQTTSSVTLKWNKVTGATGYRIYTMRKGEWKKLADTTKLTYTEKKLGSGSMFKYRVKAYTTKNGKTVWATKYKQIETSTKPATSTLKVASTAKGKATLTWSNPSGESGFEIYYSTKKDSGFKKIATTKANVKKATVSKLQSKKTYYFKVRSFKTTQSGKAYSAYSAVKSVKVK